MIVRDEASNIEKCLASVAPYINYYVICDTGSKDNTKELIKNFFDQRKIPGEILDHEWVDFGHNRSLALKACYGKTHWALMIDADDNISGVLPTNLLSDDFDAYQVNLASGNSHWKRTQIFNLKNKKWRYEEPLHEYPTCDSQAKIGNLEGPYKWNAQANGYRLKSAGDSTQKYFNDYCILKKLLLKDSKQPRKQFYAAQSAFDAGLYDIAEKEYLNNIKLEGWNEEIFYSWYRIGICRHKLERDIKDIAEAYLMAFEVAPHRAESLYNLSVMYRHNKMPNRSFIYANAGLNIPFPNNSLFVDVNCYSWGILDEVASTAYYTSQPITGIKACLKLLHEKLAPAEHVERIKSNLAAYKNKYPQLSCWNSLNIK